VSTPANNVIPPARPAPAPQAPSRSPNTRPGTSSSGPPGSDLQSGAQRIAGLLDDTGQYNNTPRRLSRAHPDYDPSADPRNSKDRDEQGRFTAASDAAAAKNGRPIVEDDDTSESTAAKKGDDQDEDTRKGDANDERAEAADDANADTAETPVDIQSLEQLASELDIPIAELKAKITHKFRAADQDVEVTLEELEKGYQRDADYRRSTGKLAEDRRAAESDYSIRMQQYEQQNHFLAQNISLAERVVAAELNDPRLDQLRNTDPAEWTARRSEIGQRLGALQQARQQAAANYQQFTDNQKSQLVQREMANLMQRMPDFSAAHRDKAGKALKALGLTEHEINDVVDHRLVLGALELADLRAEVETLRAQKQSGAKAIERVAKEIPKMAKPGKSQSQGGAQVRRDALDRLRNRARKSGRVEDAAKVLEHLI
jgi:hypothetical protein